MKLKSNDGQWLLLVAVFVIATCGLIYELVAGTLASYLLGDSVTQFSTIIGVYLFSMGIGSFLSKYFNDNLLRWFIQVELLVGFIGGFSAAILFLAFPLSESFRVVLYTLVFLTGMLVGLEIPLLMRILKDKVEFKELVSRVFTFDYIGALLASLLFPLLFVPYLGLIRTSLFFGIMNIAVGLYLLQRFSPELKRSSALKASAIVLLLAELVAFVMSESIMSYSESLTYNDRIIYSVSSHYQRIVITKNRKELRLFLNGNLQFSTHDEYRYHEALVHPAMQALKDPRKILVLGGGDGLAAREVLKYPSVQKITLVDLDDAMTTLFSTQPMLKEINQSSLTNAKVRVVNQDAFVWLRTNKDVFDCIIIDFPDPSNFSVGKLYTTSFYKLLQKALSPSGIAVVQSTSPYVAPKSFWCVNETLVASGFHTTPYHNFVPSFGEWGYIMATKMEKYTAPDSFSNRLKFLTGATLQQMLNFPGDMQWQHPLAVNKLNHQVLVEYFEEEWGNYLEQ